MPVGDMREGESVQVADGITKITRMVTRFARPGEMLYNLETHNEHVYQVTSAGVLVHNTCYRDLRDLRVVTSHAPTRQRCAIPLFDLLQE